jgi:hypothetical protein
MEKSVRVNGFNSAIACLREVRELINSKEPMEGILSDVHERILERTAAGKDYMSRNFNPYSKPYAKKKGASTPDLRISGTMLESIKTKVVSPDHGQVYVEPNAEPGGTINADMLAQIHNTGTGRQPQREFMNITGAQLQKAVKRHYDDKILEIVRRSPLRG